SFKCDWSSDVCSSDLAHSERSRDCFASLPRHTPWSHRMSERIRVLVVDDSALMRKLIPAILARDCSIEVVGTAMDGAFALKKIRSEERRVGKEGRGGV